MKKIHLILICFLVLYSPTIKSQKNNSQAAVYNIVLGGIIGGIGAVINKNSSQNTGKTFLKGFREGALGGYLLFESKRLIREFGRQEKYIYAWSSKLVNAAGNSIIENAAANNRFGEKWSFTFGFNRLEFHRKENFKAQYKIMPLSLIETVNATTKGYFNMKESLKTGHFIFKSYFIENDDEPMHGADGVTLSNSILVKKNNSSTDYIIMAHEILHVYQYENLSGLNNFLNKSKTKFTKNKKWLQSYQKYFYTDFNYLIFSSIYGLQSTQPHEKRFYESEAYFYQN